MPGDTKTKDASAIVLVGGKSSRMGRPKALLSFGGEPLIIHIVRLLQQRFAEIVVVAAPGQDLPQLPVTVIHDEVTYQGPVGGIYYGLRAVNFEMSYVVSCDAPFLNPKLIDYLLSVSDLYDVVVPRWVGRLQPLHAVYRRNVVSLLREQLDRGELRPIYLYGKVKTLIVNEEEIRRLDPSGKSFFNVNTPEDYELAVTYWNERARSSGVKNTIWVDRTG